MTLPDRVRASADDPNIDIGADGLLAVFNDAGGGKNAIGTSRLSALQQKDIAAVTVSHVSCRIGDAASALSTGIISATNQRAKQLGAVEQARLCDFLAQL